MNPSPAAAKRDSQDIRGMNPRMMMRSMRRMRRFMFASVFIPLLLLAQGAEELLYRSAMTAQSDSAKLAGLDRLIVAYPSGRYAGDAYGARFSVLMSLHQDSAAFVSAHRYLATKDSFSLPGALHFVAMELGFRKRYSDSALVFLDSAMSLYQHMHGRIDPIMLHTKALHLSLLRRFAEAETTQLEAIAMLPASADFDSRYSNYFLQLGLIQLETHPGFEGLQPIVHASFVSSQLALENSKLDSLLRLRIKDSVELVRVRDSLYEIAAKDLIQQSSDSSSAKGFAGASFSRNHVLPERALQLASEAHREVARGSLQTRAAVSSDLGLVFYSMGRYEEAARVLSEAVQGLSPYETEAYFLLGSAQEKLGKKKEALDTYLCGVTVSRPSVLMRPLQGLMRELYPHASLDSMIAVAQRKLVDFFPDKYARPQLDENSPDQRIALAELFTGSECRPCQAADVAYDKLLQRYDRSTLAVLEYHLHIPRPDPMTNPDAEARARFYNVNSTPTSIIDGTNSIPGGGQSIAAKATFAAYADAIDQRLNEPAQASVRISARIRRNKVSFSVSAQVPKHRKSLRMRVVLAEDAVRYQGANGIDEHRFVVRKMIRGAAGTAFTQAGRAAVKDAFAVSVIEDQLEKYLTTYEQKSGRPGRAFKEKKSELDPTQLYIVAFIQDDASRSILQSAIARVKR